MFTATLRFLLVTERWRYILRLDGAVIPFRPLWHATAIGFMANNIAPARAGEVARAYVASAKTGVKFTAAVASIAVERIMDTGTIVVLLALAAAAGGFSAEATIGPFTIRKLQFVTGLPFTEYVRAAVATHEGWLALNLLFVENAIGADRAEALAQGCVDTLLTACGVSR